MKKTSKKTFSVFITAVVSIILLGMSTLGIFANSLGGILDGNYETPYKEDGIMLGIDVSSYQGDIDWGKVRADGVQFAMLRICTYSLSTHSYSEDTKFSANIEGASAQGIHLGAYFFSYAKNVAEVEAEARMVVDILDNYPATFSFPIVFDAEEWANAAAAGNTIKPFAADACATFVRILEENGYYSMVYANKSWFNDVILPSNKIADVSLWQATYPAKNYAQKYASFSPRQGYSIADSRPQINSNDSNVRMWQYTDTGVVDGISGSVDMDIAYYNFSKVIPSGGYNGYTEQTHVHDFWTSYNGTSHADVCECGEIREGSEENHKNELLFDGESHFYACPCGYRSPGVGTPHTLSLKVKNNEHYYSCDCGYIDISTREGHSTKLKSDGDEHYKQCACGYIDESTRAQHSCEGYASDANGHWQECECGYKTQTMGHELENGSCKICNIHIHEYSMFDHDSSIHWKKCVWCDERTQSAHVLNNCECAQCGYVNHIFVMKNDCEYHWAECSMCGKTTPKIEHNLDGNGCIECGGASHAYEVAYDENEHWQECSQCQDKIEIAPHSISEGACADCGYAQPKDKNNGCNGAISFNAFALLTLLACTAVIRKKNKENT